MKHLIVVRKVGRVCSAPLAKFGLRKGDRLDPSPTVPDIMNIVDDPFPPGGLKLTFWRRSEEGMVKHRSPLLARKVVSMADLAVDEMHTMHLGVFQAYICRTLWQVLLSDGFYGASATGIESKFELLRADLQVWYKLKSREQARGGRPVWVLPAFDLKTLGAQGGAELVGPKAAETGSLLRFTVDLITPKADLIESGPALVQCGLALVRYLDITRDGLPKMSPSACQQLFDVALRFNSLREVAGIPFLPKMHLMMHLAAQSQRLGNPLFVAVWVDESLNRDLAKLSGAAHPSVFERRVLSTMNHQLGPISRPSASTGPPATSTPSKRSASLPAASRPFASTDPPAAKKHR